MLARTRPPRLGSSLGRVPSGAARLHSSEHCLRSGFKTVDLLIHKDSLGVYQDVALQGYIFTLGWGVFFKTGFSSKKEAERICVFSVPLEGTVLFSFVETWK